MLENLDKENLEEIEEIAGVFFKEAGHPGTFNFSHFKAVWHDFMERNRGFVFVIRREEKITGLIGAIIGPDIYSGETTTFPQFWYVLPEFRNQKDGLKLFHAMEQEAIDRGSIAILPGHLFTINSDGFQKFFQREGYEAREIMYRKILNREEL